MIPILMDHTKLLGTLAVDNTNGLGALSECTSCIVKEERNGAFTLELKIPQSAKHFSEITVGGVIKAKAREAGDPQLFRIEKITKPMRGVVTVYANHISYDLNKTSVLPFGAVGIVQTLQQLKAKMQGGQAFSFTSNISNYSSNFSNRIPQSARAILGGQEGSVLDVFGGEFLFDNLTINLLANRGHDNGVTLRYGKNITDLQQEENISSTYTAVQPYAKDGDENIILGSLLTVVSSAEPKILNLDLTNKFSDNDVPTVAKINTYAQQYVNSNNVGIPKVSIKVSFVALWQTEEYKNFAPLERVSLCDTVTVVFEKLGVNAKAKVISTTYDTLRERYDEIEIGDARSTLATKLNEISEEASAAVANATGFLDNTIQQFTSLVANGLGLFVTKEEVGETGGYKYYLHNKPTLAASQYQWTFNSNGFAVSQDYGRTWSAGVDASGNAVFNSLAANLIQAMNIKGTTIQGGSISGASITGGTVTGASIVAGGNNNTDGTITVKNANGAQVGKWDKDGISVSAGTISGTTISGGTITGASIVAGGNNNTDGTITVKNSSGTQIGKWDKDGLSISSGTISGALITGSEIDSGDMYWYKGTSHEAHLYAARWTWENAEHEGVYLGTSAWWCNAGNSHHIMYNNFIQFRVGNDVGYNTMTIRDGSISLMRSVSGAHINLSRDNAYISYGSQEGIILVSNSGVTVGTFNYSGGFLQKSVKWRTLTVDGQSVTFLVAGS